MVTPYLCTKGARAAIDFYQAAFGAVETSRITDGERIGHAELTIGSARIMLADEYPEIEVLSPQTLGGSPVTLVLEMADVDAVADQAVTAGATLLRAPTTEPYGRVCKLKDPFGHVWMVITPA